MAELEQRDVAAGVEGISSGDVQRDKLMVETDLKLLACWDPRYNAKQQLELTGANGSDLFAGMAKAELLAELSRRMSTPEIARALQAMTALPKPDKG